MGVFEWLVEMGPIKALLLFNAIAAVITAISLWFVYWITPR